MAISRSQLLKELEPGLHALFGLSYKRYEQQYRDIYEILTSDRAFEEEVALTGFGAAPVKPEGAPIAYDEAGEAWTARYTHETIALGFAITEEAMEDNLYDKLSTRYTKALARSMAYTKNVKGASPINTAFDTNFPGGDGKPLLASDHPLANGGTWANKPAVAADLSETAIEDAIINIAGWVDDRGIPIAVKARRMIIPQQLIFVATRLFRTEQRPGTADNDVNAQRALNVIPDGYRVNNFLTDPDAWFIKTDVEDGLKMFQRVAIKNAMEGDFETGNVRYKTRERYSFGWSDPRTLYGSPGAA